MWNPADVGWSPIPTAQLYPGDQYVDIVAADIYSPVYPSSLYDWTTGQTDATLQQWFSNPANEEHYWSYPDASQWQPTGNGEGWGLADAMAFAAAHGKDVTFTVTVTIPVTTLCPCSKAISARGAHNQRGYVTLALRSVRPIWIEDMIALIEASASSEIYSLLKRPDEKAVTERAYHNPVFVEDLVRNIAARSNAVPEIAW